MSTFINQHAVLKISTTARKFSSCCTKGTRHNLVVHKFHRHQQRRLKPQLLLSWERERLALHVRSKQSVVNDLEMCVWTWSLGLFARSNNFPVPGRTHNQWAPRVNIWSKSVPGPPLLSLSIIHYLYKRSYYSGPGFPFSLLMESCASFPGFCGIRPLNECLMTAQMKLRLFLCREYSNYFLWKVPCPITNKLDQ